LELPSVSHDTATGLHHSAASEATTAPPAKQFNQQGTASSASGTLFFPLYFFWFSTFSSYMQNVRSACRRMGGK